MKVYELEERDGVMYAEQPRVHFRRKDTAFRAERKAGGAGVKKFFAAAAATTGVVFEAVIGLPVYAVIAAVALPAALIALFSRRAKNR